MIIKGLPEKYRACAELMGKRLSLDTANVTLRFEEAEEMRVSFDGGEGVIACNSANRFARLLGIFASKYKSGAFSHDGSVPEGTKFRTAKKSIPRLEESNHPRPNQLNIASLV